MANYSLIHSHLRNINILVTRRLEILNYLRVLNNKTYEFVDTNRLYFDKVAARAKKLRVEVKSATHKEKRIWSSLVAEAVEHFLDEVDHHVTIILNDILKVKKAMVRTVDDLKKRIADDRLSETIMIETLPINGLISELNELVKNYKEVRGMIQDLVLI